MSKTPRNEQWCGNCWFFEPGGGTTSGFCHRYPPTVISNSDSSMEATVSFTTLPEVDAKDDWCGEWQEETP